MQASIEREKNEESEERAAFVADGSIALIAVWPVIGFGSAVIAHAYKYMCSKKTVSFILFC